MASYRVILADHHALIREGLKRVLGEVPDIEVIGEAAGMHELFDFLKTAISAPHMVILDLSAPNVQEMQFIRNLKAGAPHLKVLVLSMYKDKEYLSEAVSNEVEGYLLKENVDKELLPAMETIRTGRIYGSSFP